MISEESKSPSSPLAIFDDLTAFMQPKEPYKQTTASFRAKSYLAFKEGNKCWLDLYLSLIVLSFTNTFIYCTHNDHDFTNGLKKTLTL